MNANPQIKWIYLDEQKVTRVTTCHDGSFFNTDWHRIAAVVVKVYSELIPNKKWNTHEFYQTFNILNGNDIIAILIFLPKRVWVNATHEQSVLSKAFPIVKAPTASMGIPTNIMKRSLTIKFIRIMLNLVLWACFKNNKVALIFQEIWYLNHKSIITIYLKYVMRFWTIFYLICFYKRYDVEKASGDSNKYQINTGYYEWEIDIISIAIPSLQHIRFS